MPSINTIKNRFLILAPVIPAALWAKFGLLENTVPSVLQALSTALIISWIVIRVENYLVK